MKTFKVLLAVVLGFVLAPITHAQVPGAASAPDAGATTAKPIDPAKEAEIRKMLQLTGREKMAQQVLTQMITIFKSRNSSVPDEFWTRFESQMDTSGLIEKIIPLYDKYYSLDDLKAANAFYSSPAGQRMLAATPQLTKESMQIGQEWGRALGEKLVAELQKEKQQETSATTGTTAKPADK